MPISVPTCVQLEHRHLLETTIHHDITGFG